MRHEPFKKCGFCLQSDEQHVLVPWRECFGPGDDDLALEPTGWVCHIDFQEPCELRRERHDGEQLAS
jgi:hypothetical protein